MPACQRIADVGLAVVVVLLSIAPVMNMLSSGADDEHVVQPAAAREHLRRLRQRHAGALRDRHRRHATRTTPTDATAWREYEFKGKPGDPARRPPQVAPYHLRLDWLMWFAAMSSPSDYPWFPELLLKLLEGDAGDVEPAPIQPLPRPSAAWIRAELYRYRFTTPEERARTGAWWHRERIGPYFPAVRLQPGAPPAR